MVNFQTAMSKLGVLNMVEPGAIDTIKKLYGGQFDVLPYEYNIEGFWYDKKIFADHGITVPTTWPELVSAAAKLKAAGVLPLSASGQQGWPITRLVSGYLYRSLGPDALQKVASGQAKLTDPQYVAAAQQIADLGKRRLLRSGRRIDRLQHVDQRIPHRQGRDDVHGELAAGQHQ